MLLMTWVDQPKEEQTKIIFLQKFARRPAWARLAACAVGCKLPGTDFGKPTLKLLQQLPRREIFIGNGRAASFQVP